MGVVIIFFYLPPLAFGPGRVSTSKTIKKNFSNKKLINSTPTPYIINFYFSVKTVYSVQR